MTYTRQSTPFNQNTLSVPNGELYYEISGDGPPLILIHAGFSDRRDWHYQVNALSKSHTTIVYDQRGSGKSSVVTGAFSPAEDLKALMDHLNLKQAALIGHSIGGTIALDFAMQFPDRISALVLLASGLNGHGWSKEYLGWAQSIWTAMDPVTMTQNALAAPFYALAMDNLQIKLEIEIMTRESFHKILAWKTFDPNDVKWFHPNQMLKLSDLQVPTLSIYGDKDSSDIKQIAHALMETLPHIRTALLENADHLLNFEKPVELNRHILNFLLD